MKLPSDYLTDQDVCTLLGISARTLREMLAVAPEDGPSAFVHTGIGTRYPRRRWRADLLWEWLEAVQSAVKDAARRDAEAAGQPRVIGRRG